MQDDELTAELEQHETFADYEQNFTPSPIKKTIQIEWFKVSSFFNKDIKENSKEFRKLFADFCQSDDYKTLVAKEHRKQFIDFAKAIECDKLNTFIQIENNKVAILQSPPDKVGNKSNKAQIVKFLGYDWSQRKGDEGIKYVTNKPFVENVEDATDGDEGESEVEAAINSIKYIDTPLYNPDDEWDKSKFAFAIRKHIYEQCRKFSFGENEKEIQPSFVGEMGELLSFANLSDMIDFSRTEFDKAIKLTADKKIEIESKYPLVKLEDIAEIISGQSPESKYYNDNKRGLPFYQGKKDFGTIELNEPTIWTSAVTKESYKGDILMSVRAPVGDVNFNPFDRICIGRGLNAIRCRDVNQAVFVFNYLLTVKESIAGHQGSSFASISQNEVKDIKIPLPPIDIQRKIVSECEKVDKEYNNSRKDIGECKKKIAEVIGKIESETRSLNKLCSVINPSKSDIRTAPNDMVVSFVDMPSVSNDGFIEVKTDKPLGELRKGSYTYFAENDIIIAKITPCMENGKCAIATGLTNGIGMGSSEFHVFRCDTSRINTKFLFAFLNRDVIRKEAEKRMTGASGHRRVPISFYENLQIPVPSLSEQQRIVSEIEQCEAKIAEAKTVMAGCAERKKEILRKYLV